MHEAFVLLNGSRTKITTFGRWIEESPKDAEDIVIIIPGNPGVTGFYDVFAKTLHDKLGYPVWCVGHAGHNLPKESISPLPKLDTHKQLYGLKGQVEHKVEFFAKYVPKNARVHLIGHSIGSYMILELLDNPLLKDKVSDVYLLFPTIEHMATTKNGKFLTTFVRPILWLIICLSWVFTILPTLVQNILLYIYMFITGTPVDQHIGNIKNLIKPGVLRRVFFLAYEEMDQVKERNNEVIIKYIDKIKLYYGMNDGWAPGSFCDKLKADILKVDAQVCTFNHSFVLRRSIDVGYVVSDWIKAKQ